MRTVILIGALALVACDGNSGVDAGGLDAGPRVDGGELDAGGDDAGVLDAETPDAEMGDAGPVDAGGSDGGLTPGAYDGTASLTLSRGSTVDLTIMGGYFASGVGIRGFLPGCTHVRSVGPCVQATCSAFDPSDDAGTLTGSVAGTMVTTSTVASTYVATTPGLAFTAGQTITLATTGATVPAFTGDVLAPPPPGVTLPTTATRGSELALSWSSSLAADEVEVGMTAGTTAVLCWVDASAGGLTVPASITADLDATTFVTLKSMNVTRVTAGTYQVAVIAADSIGGTIAFE